VAFIQGASRCQIEIADDLVRKTAPDPVYSVRLRQQILKQRSFAEHNRLDFCLAPDVIAERVVDNDIYQAEMKYINGLDFIEFVKHSSRDELERMARQIAQVIAQNIEASRSQTVPHAVLKEKIALIAAGCDSPLLAMFDEFPGVDLTLPVGVCHGDLTLSNVLFCHNGIALIDFLDNFVETPLQDMVKVRQDTCYQWSCQLYRHEYDRVRTMLALKFLDRRFDELFSRHAFYTRHYPIFQFVNLARVLPYCETVELRTHIENSMKNLMTIHV
jgi:tRNA A-37 threonylcarbamoyl transferase component Bud32